MQTSKAPAFARIAVSEKSAVYIQIQGDQLRAAMSVEGLQAAAPVKMRERHEPRFTLPVPADQLPAGVTAIKASLALTQYQSGANAAHLSAISRSAGRMTEKAEWQYVSQLSVPAGPNWENAPSIKLPEPANVKASLEATPATGKLALGLQTHTLRRRAERRAQGRPAGPG